MTAERRDNSPGGVTAEEARCQFSSALKKMFGNGKSNFDVGTANGVSNAPSILDNGLRFGQYNINSKQFDEFQKQGKAFLVTSPLRMPEAILHMCLVFEGDTLLELGKRRDEIKKALKSANQKKTEADKTRFYLHEGNVYLRQATSGKPNTPDPLRVEPDDPSFGQGVRASKLCYLVTPMAAESSPVTASYLRFLRGVARDMPVVSLHEERTPPSLCLKDIVERVRELRAFYDEDTIASYYVSLNHLDRKHFVILSGISGTGKTQLAKAYACAIFGAGSLTDELSGFRLIPVRPDWIDPTHVLGFMDVVQGRYHRTPFLQAILDATYEPDQPVFVCLDEMNLAQPEYYLAEVLSAMESGEPIHLHSEEEEKAGVPKSIVWPRNLYLTGTVNVDETTRPFSPKVLDRANVIELSHVEVRDFAEKLKQWKRGLEVVLNEDRVGLLTNLSDILSPHNLQFGYRTVEEIADYMCFEESQGRDVNKALDRQIEQKILTKLRGGREQEDMLARLRKALTGLEMSRSVSVVERMQHSLSQYESFQYWL